MSPHVQQLVEMALREDIGPGDVTSEYFVPAERDCSAVGLVKAEGVIAGLNLAEAVFLKVDSSLKFERLLSDGDAVEHGSLAFRVTGPARSILTAERTVLNFLQRLSGVASKTRSYTKLIEGSGAVLLDTRKTTPGWRELEKAAVKAGGGQNHRMGLYDRAMVKDNHLVAEGGAEALQAAISRLKSEKPEVEVELEADRLDQVERFLKLDGVDFILLDNMSNDELRQAVALRGKSGPGLEASGGVTHETIRGIAETGVDFISVGALTHSAVALDISLDFQA